MRRFRTCAAVLISITAVLSFAPAAAPIGATGVNAPIATEPGDRSITYVGPMYDQRDFERLNVGRWGFWFPQFDAGVPVAGRPTAENARDSLPPWVRPLNHSTGPADPGCDAPALVAGCLPTFAFRTFSQDGPARSKGGQAAWNTFTLPDGATGLSGAIVDPHTRGNSNNTINRIQLRDAVPSTFYFHVVTDNTNLEHDPTNLLVARGNAGLLDQDATQVEPMVVPSSCDLTFNGLADVHTFRFDGFSAGDYIKLRLNGDSAPKEGASFGGLLFDETFEPRGSHRRAPRGGGNVGAHAC